MLTIKKLPVLFAAIFVTIAMFSFPKKAEANMSSTPWIHSIIQDGGHIEITVSIFDEVEASVQQEGAFPELDAPYTLEWLSTEGMGTVFEDRVFEAEEADEVIPYGCQEWNPQEYMSGYACEEDPSYCVDCDEDDVPECYGICGVAYRFQVTDYCPGFAPDFWYQMSTSDEYSVWNEPGSLGASNWITIVEEVGDQCDSICSVSSVGSSSKKPGLLRMLLALI